MANLKMLWNNECDDATLSGGSWDATLTLANLQDRQLQLTARSTNDDLTSTIINADLGSDNPIIQSMVIVNHNLSINTSLFRIRLSDDVTFATSDYDSGWLDVYESLFTTNNLDWEDSNFWFGKILLDDLQGYSLNIIHLMPETYSNRYVRIEFDDTANTDGYIDLGRLMLAPIQALDINMEYGANIGWIDNSLVSESIGGAEYFDDRSKKRELKFTVGAMGKEESMQRMFELQRRKGTTGEIFVIPDSDDAENMFRESFLGRMTRLTPQTHQLINRYKTAFQIRELL